MCMLTFMCSLSIYYSTLTGHDASGSCFSSDICLLLHWYLATSPLISIYFSTGIYLFLHWYLATSPLVSIYFSILYLSTSPLVSTGVITWVITPSRILVNDVMTWVLRPSLILVNGTMTLVLRSSFILVNGVITWRIRPSLVLVNGIVTWGSQQNFFQASLRWGDDTPEQIHHPLGATNGKKFEKCVIPRCPPRYHGLKSSNASQDQTNWKKHC